MSAIRIDSRAYFAALGKQVAMLRKARKFTQSELARAIGVSPQAVFSYELGDRRISVLVLARIAHVLDVSAEDLIDLARPGCRSGRLSPRAARHAERLQALRRTDQRFIVRLIDLLEDRSAQARH